MASFAPKQPSATSAAPAGSTTSFSLAGECTQVRFAWKATTAGGVANIRWGKGTQAAVTTDLAMQDGATEVFSKFDATDGAVIGAGTLYVVSGTGE